MYILDENDNGPVITPDPDLSPESYVLIIPEDSEINTTIIHINATDADSGKNGLITYSIIGGTRYFSVNMSTGLVTLKSQLDREDGSVTLDQRGFGLFTLKMLISDSGENPQKVQLSVSRSYFTFV